MYAEWEKRAKRPGLLSVMSERWSEEECQKASKKLKKAIFDFIPDLTDKTVLDVGCGIGRFTADLAKNSKQVYAIDFSSAMLSKAKKRFNNKNVYYRHLDILNTGFPNQKFDFIFEVTVLQHITRQKEFAKATQEIKRLIKKEGYVFLCGEMSKYRKKVSPFTVIRTLDEYKKLIKPLKLLKLKKHLCLTDHYLLTLWG